MLWALQLSSPQGLRYTTSRKTFRMWLGKDGVSFSHHAIPLRTRFGTDAPGWHFGRSSPIVTPTDPPYWRRGCGGVHVGCGVCHMHFVSIPYYVLILIALPLPVIWCYQIQGRWGREKRRRLGLCEQCGYDLRGSPERCPECGLVVEKDFTAKDAEGAEILRG